MRTFELHSLIVVPQPIDAVFEFFADAGNLDVLTPDWLHFRILTPKPIEMRPGAEIDYRLKLRGVPISWRSLISAWEPPHRFVDEQVRGPYRKWVHEHVFKTVPEGTLVEDRVEYGVWGGPIVNSVLVEPDLDRIFEYRRAQLAEHFAVGSHA